MSSEGQIGPQEWERVVELLATAKALDAADRERYLEAVDAPASVVAEVRRLLEQHPASAFLEPPSLPDQAPTLFGSGLVGARFGEFVLEDELGRGGMGVVYRARQLNLGRQVALKILPIASQGRMGAIERFRREARAAALLDHPNVVPVLAYGEDAGTFWYAMQYVEGHDLAVEIARQRMRRSLPEGERDQVQIHLAPFDGPQYLTEVVERFAELAQGVHHAHLNGIVHRDIKPQNILVDREGGLHLADFGLAKDARFDSLSRSGDVLGTPSYMSPEQARARRVEIDHRTDIYSLSVVLYELLALRPPHVGKSFEEVMSRILEEPPAPLRKLNPRVPQDLALVCGMGMEKAPEHRYGSAQALEDDLLRFQRHEAVLARGPSVRRIARGWLRRNRLRLGAAAIALASVVAGLQVASVRAQAREVAQVEGEARALLELDDWTLAIDRLVEVRRQVEGLGPDALRSETLTPFLERLDRFRDSTLEEGSARIAAGLGTPSADAFAPFLPPLRLGEIDAGLALLDGLQRLFPNDATVARAADPSRLFPSIDLRAELVDAGGSRPLAAGEGIATVETLDPFRDAFSDPRPLGPLPIEGLRLPPGHYRFTASIPGIGHAELLRTFEAGPRTHALQARIHDASARAIPLVDIPTGNLRLVPQKQVGCLWLRQRTLDVPAFRLGRTEVSNGEFVDYLAAASRAGWPAAEPPANWVALGFDPILGLAESAETLESWRNLPVVGMSLDDARGYAEWHGLRLPMHTELEYAMAGADEGVGEWTPGDDVDGQPLANVLGATASFATSDREAGYRLYLENAASVFDERFEQEPFGLLHAHGNVSELSESPLTEPVANRVSLMSEDHVVIGSYYGSAADGLALHTHGRSGVESYYYRVQTGFRLAASDFTESKR